MYPLTIDPNDSLLEIVGCVVGHRRRGNSHPLRLTEPVDLRGAPGELICLLGRNGCGKTSLLRTIAGLQPPLFGAMRIAGQAPATMDAKRRARLVALSMTRAPIPPWLTVAASIAQGRHPYTGRWGTLMPRDHRAIERAIEEAGIEEIGSRPLQELSDGNLQRVFVARAIAQETPILLLDEPTAFLDAEARLALFRLLRRLIDARGTLVLCATHEIAAARKYADRLWRFGDGGHPVPLVEEHPVMIA